MNEDGKILLEHLIKTLESFSNKFDTFITTQTITNSEIKAELKEHRKELDELEESDEKKFAERHPMIMEVVKYGIIIACFCVVAYFMPNVAKLIGSI